MFSFVAQCKEDLHLFMTEVSRNQVCIHYLIEQDVWYGKCIKN